MDPLQIQIFASGLSFFVSILIVVFLLINNPRDRISQSFIVAVSLISAWAVFGLLSHLSEEIELSKSFKIISVIFISLLSGGIANFALTFYEESRKTIKKSYSYHRKIFYSISAILTLILISDLMGFSQLIVAGMIPDQTYVFSPIPGKLMPVLILFFFVSALYTGLLALLTKRNSSAIVRKQANWISGSIVAALVAGGTRFATWYEIPISPAIASLAAPIFVIGIFYAIRKHGLFNTKTITAEFLTFAIWIFLVFRISFAKTIEEQITEIILFIVVVVLGIFLIRSVSKEVSQKEELEKITKKLKNLNETLEEKVEERTQEIIHAKTHTDTIIKNLTLGLIEYDEKFNVLRINIAAEEILGIKKEDVQGKQILQDKKERRFSSIVAVLHENVTKNIKEFAENTQVHEISIDYPKKKDLEIITTPAIYSKETGKKTFIKLVQDVTHEKQLKKAKGDFLTIAAHQLKTPLSGVKWMLGLAQSGDLDKLNSEKKKAFIDQAYGANEHMIKIVNNFLGIARMEEGYYEYDFKKQDLTKLVIEMVNITRFTTKDKDLSIKTKFPETPLPEITFDEQKIEMVLQNILENAAIYTPAGGNITVTLSQKKKMITVEVSDTGIGIPKEEMDKVFTKFFRSTKALHTETDHSGLGLFISKEIIIEHGGTIDVESTEDKGTTVTISLPIK